MHAARGGVLLLHLNAAVCSALDAMSCWMPGAQDRQLVAVGLSRTSAERHLSYRLVG
jgi:hypothetical protein